MTKKTIGGCIVVGVLILVSFLVFISRSVKPAAGAKDLVSVTKNGEKDEKKTKASLKTNRKVLHAPDILKRRQQAVGKPNLNLEAEEEAKLTAEQASLLKDLRAALDADDKSELIRLVQKMQKLDEWPDGIPTVLKKAAIDGLSWFGPEGLPELVGFFADSNPEVVDEVTSRYEDALADPELSPEQLSALLISAAKFLNDSVELDSMFTYLNELPHTLGVKTIKEILANGNSMAQKVLPDNIDFYTSEEGLYTSEKLDEWLEKNPDLADDQEVNF